LPTPAPARVNLLADIQKGARLKKVSDQEKKDRSAAIVPGTEPPKGSSGASSGPVGADAGLAGALASALAARKSKVAHSGKCLIPVPCSNLVLIITSVQTMKTIKMIGKSTYCCLK
jgi:hypothetical protein